MPEILEQPAAASGNVSRLNPELVEQIILQVQELPRKAAELGRHLKDGNTAADSIDLSGSQLVHRRRTGLGNETFAISPEGGGWNVAKTLETEDGSRVLIAEVRNSGQDEGEPKIKGKLRRYDNHGNTPGDIELPEDATLAILETVMGDLTGKIVEREQNTSEKINADIAEVLGIDFPPKPEAPPAPPAA